MKTIFSYTTLFLFSLLMLAGGLQAQNGDVEQFTKDFKKMQDAYLNLDKLHARIDIHLREGSGATQYHQQAEVRKSGDDYLYHLGPQTVLYTQKANIVLNKTSQTLIYGTVDREAASSLALMSPELESLVEKYEEIKLISKSNGKLHYQIKTSREAIVLTDLFLDADTYLIERVEYVYNPASYGEGTHCIIRFEEQNTAPVFAKNEFDEKRFVRKKGNALTVAPDYAGYHLQVVETN